MVRSRRCCAQYDESYAPWAVSAYVPCGSLLSHGAWYYASPLQDRFGGSKKSASMKKSKRYERKEADKRQRAATAVAPEPVVAMVAKALPPVVKTENPNVRGTPD